MNASILAIFGLLALANAAQQYSYQDISEYLLILIGIRQGTFHPLFLFGSDFVCWILIKISKLFWRWKLTSIWLIWHPAKLIESYKKSS